MTITEINATPEVHALLPYVLIDWLVKLAKSDAFGKYPMQILSLTYGRLGGQSVQDVCCADTRRRVFGFPPVTCKLLLLNRNHQWMIAAAQ